MLLQSHRFSGTAILKMLDGERRSKIHVLAINGQDDHAWGLGSRALSSNPLAAKNSFMAFAKMSALIGIACTVPFKHTEEL